MNSASLPGTRWLPEGRLFAPVCWANPLWFADGSHFATLPSPAEELIAAIGLEPGYVRSGRHIESLQNFSCFGIDSSHITFIAFPGAVPELSVDPGDTGDEAVGLDDAENRACFGIDLIDLPVLVLPDPERSFGPGESRVSSAAGRGDRGEHIAGLRIDLPDTAIGELNQVPAVEGLSGARSDVDRAQRLTAGRIDGLQLVARSEPDVLAVIRDSVHIVHTIERPILTENLGPGSIHI